MKYSIITPVYNRSDCIARCIESVIKNLEYDVDLEHIIVDDGSIDESPGIIQDYVEKYRHIKYIAFPTNRGTNAARNAAISIASSDFCILLDSDDYFVDNAIKLIDDTVSPGGYSEYLFATDDRIDAYKGNDLIGDKQSVVLMYEDFLFGKVSFDFVHVIKTEILQKYPFDEDLRIHEGTFFKRFYKESKKILYSSNVVTIRERNRSDSVTRTGFLTNKEAVNRIIKAYELDVKWFLYDYLISEEGKSALANIYRYLLVQYLSIGSYNSAKKYIDEIKCLGYSVPVKINILYRFRLGFLYSFARTSYLKIKYELFNMKMQK